MKSITAALTAFAASALVSIAHAGAVYTAEQRDAASGRTLSTTTLSVQDKQLRAEQLETGKTQAEHVMIFKDGNLLMIDHGKKTYTVLDKAAMQRLGSAANNAMQQLEQAMAGMSEEQKAMVQKMMGKNLPGPAKSKSAPVKLRNTGKTEQVGEYTCRLWEGTRDGVVQWQHCVVDFDKVTGSREAMESMKAMSAMMEEFMQSMDAAWFRDAVGDAWEGMKDIDGYPVLTRTFKDGKPDTETVLQSARTATLAASSFEAPSGYKRKDIDLP